MRWQYCPPASRTVICGFKLLIVLSILFGAELNGFRRADPLHHLLLRVVQQPLRLDHRRNGLLYFGVLRDGNLAGFVHAERRDVHLAFQLLADPLAIRIEIGVANLDLVLLQETVVSA